MRPMWAIIQRRDDCLRRTVDWLWRTVRTWYPIDASAHRKKHDDAITCSEDFAASLIRVREFKELSIALRLRLYGLYKQSTLGDAPIAPSRSAFDPAIQLKWQSWSAVRGMPADEAMRQYVDVVNSVEDEDDDGIVDTAMLGLAGPVMSSMSLSVEDQHDMEQVDRRLPFHAAARRGDVDRCKALLSEGVLIDELDEYGHTALHWACDGGFSELVQVLLEHDARVNAQNCDGSTPLHMAYTCEHTQVLQLLLRAGASITLLDSDGCTPLDLSPLCKSGGG